MNERLREINRSLHMLDEAHRLGRISREDYRARRRHLLGTLCDGGGITARNAVVAETIPRSRDPALSRVQSGHDEAISAVFPWWSRWFKRKGWFSRR